MCPRHTLGMDPRLEELKSVVELFAEIVSGQVLRLSPCSLKLKRKAACEGEPGGVSKLGKRGLSRESGA